jgi:C1A family cysteine protease
MHKYNYLFSFLGLVGPVKDEGACAASIAFASTAAMEACFARLTNNIDGLSEQQMLDCGNGKNGIRACVSSPLDGFVQWVQKEKVQLASDTDYPYTGNGAGPCLGSANSGPKIKPRLLSANNVGSMAEDMIQRVVANQSVPIAAIVFTEASYMAFDSYRGGIFDGCDLGKGDPILGGRALAVVGYGTDEEDGQDYWLLKNNFGPDWGESGYMRLRRGTGACSIGKWVVVVDCTLEDGGGGGGCIFEGGKKGK